MSDSLANAAQGIIDIRFTPSAADLRVLVRLDPDRPFHMILTVLSRIGAFALAAGLTGAGLWAADLLERDFLPNLISAIAGGSAGIVAFRLLVEGTWRRRIRLRLLPGRQVRVTGDGQMLTVKDDHASVRLPFSGIDRLKEASTHLVLYRGRISIVALPKAAFEKPAVFDAFASFAKDLVTAHQNDKLISEKNS